MNNLYNIVIYQKISMNLEGHVDNAQQFSFYRA